jgi:5-methylthioribose kinase
MDSITKLKLTDNELELLVKDAFGATTSVVSCESLMDGWFNSIYSITLNTDQEVILKIAPPSSIKVLRYEKNIMDTEVQVMQLMKAKNIVPVPAVLHYSTSKSIINSKYFFMEKIKSSPYDKLKPNLSDSEKEKIEIELGQLNKNINNIKSEYFGYYSNSARQSKKWSVAFGYMLKDILDDGKECDVKLPMPYDEIEALIMSKKDIFDLVNTPCLVHWDLHDGNLFIDQADKINGVIDFERTIWADPLMEVYFGDFFDKRYFCKGYGSFMTFTLEENLRRDAYNIYLYLIMVIEGTYRNYTDEGHKKWIYDTLEKELNLFITKYK